MDGRASLLSGKTIIPSFHGLKELPTLPERSRMAWSCVNSSAREWGKRARPEVPLAAH